MASNARINSSVGNFIPSLSTEWSGFCFWGWGFIHLLGIPSSLFIVAQMELQWQWHIFALDIT